MSEPLIVDTGRLDAAGRELQGVSLPAPPPSLAVTGSDRVSAAINEVLPMIESPVVDGLRGVDALLASTASKVTTAAELYAQADRTLGANLSNAAHAMPSTASDQS